MALTYKLTGKNVETVDGLEGVITYVNFTVCKGDVCSPYAVSLYAPDPENFTPLEELDDEGILALAKSVFGTGYTMSEAEFEAELDAKALNV